MQPTIHFPINISLICNQIPDYTGEMNFLESKGGQFITVTTGANRFQLCNFESVYYLQEFQNEERVAWQSQI